MKKIIALLLCAVVCLSFVACNNESGNTETPPVGENTGNNGTTNGSETKPQTEVIEISLDNWQEYFEVISIPRIVTNDFDEPIAFHIKTVFRLKDNWKDVTENLNISVEYSCTDGYRAMFQYNTQTQELVQGEKDSSGILSDRIKDTFKIPSMPIEFFIQNGYSFAGDGYSPNTFSMEGSIVNGSCEMYSNIEIHRIQGTMTVTK